MKTKIRKHNGAVARELITIDFPQENETIRSDSYTLRIGAAEKGLVEVSVDGGPWNGCRRAEGYWWFDWTGYAPGRHAAEARLVPEQGGSPRSYSRRFKVEPR